jgi:RNA polymerase sigma factor (sigma-70 family)
MTLNEAYELYSKDSSELNKEIFGAEILRYVNTYFRKYGGDVAGETSRSSFNSMEDTLGECVLRIWERLPKYNPTKAAFKTWVTQIIMDELKDGFRDYTRRNEVMISDRDVLVHTHRSLDDKLTLKQLVAKLTLKEQALIRYRLQGYSFEDMSHSSGIPAETLRKRWQRVQEKMSRLTD